MMYHFAILFSSYGSMRFGTQPESFAQCCILKTLQVEHKKSGKLLAQISLMPSYVKKKLF